MKKKICIGSILCMCFLLTGCTNTDKVEESTKQSSVIEKLEQKIDTLTKENEEAKIEVENKNAEQSKIQEEKKQLQTKSDQQASQIDSLNKTVDSFNKEKEAKENPAEPLKITFSGEVIIGEDLEPGSYDIRLPGEGQKYSSFKLYEDASDKDYQFESLSPARDGKPADELKTFKLKKGNILEISGNIEFLKIR